jgi:hypothetical protein
LHDDCRVAEAQDNRVGIDNMVIFENPNNPLPIDNLLKVCIGM